MNFKAKMTILYWYAGMGLPLVNTIPEWRVRMSPLFDLAKRTWNSKFKGFEL